MRSDTSIGGAYRSIPTKETKKPFVFVKKAVKKKTSKNDATSNNYKEIKDKVLLDITV